MKITPKLSKSGLANSSLAFEEFYFSLRPSLKLWEYFVNWEKVFRNTKDIEIQLNIWNYLLGKENFDNEFLNLLTKHPEIVHAIPSLVVRDGDASEVFSVVEDLQDLTKPDLVFDFSKPAISSTDRQLALKFVKDSGLIQLFAKDKIKNLVDYVIGVEAGLDSNGRKNRSGDCMQKVVEMYLRKFCTKTNCEYIPQATSSKIKAKWNFEVPVDKSSRAFDFAISNGKKLILMEVNFYGSKGGSKLKATAGEFKELYDFLKENSPKTDFVWITDGKGWHTAKKPLESAFERIDYVWNLAWLSKGYLEDLI